jgi:hypothetical protein
MVLLSLERLQTSPDCFVEPCPEPTVTDFRLVTGAGAGDFQNGRIGAAGMESSSVVKT